MLIMRKEFEEQFKDYKVKDWLRTEGLIDVGNNNFEYYVCYQSREHDTAIIILLKKDNTIKVILDKDQESKDTVFESGKFQEVKEFIETLIK